MSQYLLSLEQWFAYGFDIFLTLYFFRNLYGKEALKRKRRMLLSLLPLLLLYPLMMTPFPIPTMPLRYFYRWALIFLSLLLYKAGNWKQCFYFSALCSLSFLAVQNFVITSKFIDSYQSETLMLSILITLLMEYCMPFLVFHLASANIEFKKMHRIHLYQVVMVALLVPIGLYVKDCFFSFADAELTPGLSDYLYPIIISLLTLTIVANFDRIFILRKERERQTLIDLSRQYQYQNLQDQLSVHEEVRHLHHDMKNHLLTLSALGNEQQEAYIKSLLAELSAFGDSIETNSVTLNVLLSQKVRSAREKAVRIKADLDMSAVAFVEPIDICAIFGNALDNAIEAAAQVPDEENRFVSVKGGAYADLFVVRIANSCVGKPLVKENGLLRTTKENAMQHGIGLESIRRTLQRYQGVLTFHPEGDMFVLKFSFPLRQESL